MAHLSLFFALVIAAAPVAAADMEPTDVRAFDTPNDQGYSITLTWRRIDFLPDSARYRISVSESVDGPYL